MFQVDITSNYGTTSFRNSFEATGSRQNRNNCYQSNSHSFFFFLRGFEKRLLFSYILPAYTIRYTRETRTYILYIRQVRRNPFGGQTRHCKLKTNLTIFFPRKVKTSRTQVIQTD